MSNHHQNGVNRVGQATPIGRQRMRHPLKAAPSWSENETNCERSKALLMTIGYRCGRHRWWWKTL